MTVGSDSPDALLTADAAAPRQLPQRVPGQGTILVLGLLSIIFASVELASTAHDIIAKDSLESSIDDALKKAPRSLDWHNEPELQPVLRRLGTANLCGNGISVVMSLILLFFGIALVRKAPWSRPATILWAAAALPLTALLAMLQATMIAPAFSRLVAYVEKAVPGLAPDDAFDLRLMEAFLRSWWIVALIYAAFPAVLLCLMSRRVVRDALARPTARKCYSKMP